MCNAAEKKCNNGVHYSPYINVSQMTLGFHSGITESTNADCTSVKSVAYFLIPVSNIGRLDWLPLLEFNRKRVSFLNHRI